MSQIELSEDEVNEVSAAAMGHAAERDFSHNGSARAPVAKTAVAKSKYHVKSKKTGKIVSTHASAPDAVRARGKLGTAETHSIIKEEFSLMEEIKNLINAIQSGKTLDIESSFNEVMSAKLVGAIDNRRAEIASSLFADAAVQTESVNESYHAAGSVGEHKFKVKYDDAPTHNHIAKQNPHLSASHVNAVHDHIEEHGDDDMSGTKSTQGAHKVHITSNE